MCPVIIFVDEYHSFWSGSDGQLRAASGCTSSLSVSLVAGIAQGKFSLISSSLEKVPKMTFNNSSPFDDISNDFVYSLFTGKTS